MVTPVNSIVVVAAIVKNNETYLITQRQKGTHLEDCWEFPGGKCEPGETHEICLRREIREELGVDITIGHELFSTTHRYNDLIVRIHFYRCNMNGIPQPLLNQPVRWVTRDRLSKLKFPPADKELIDLIVKNDSCDIRGKLT